MKNVCVAILICLSLVGCAMTNTQIVNSFQSGNIYVGMTKQDLINRIGYPPEGKSSPDMFYSRYVKTKVTGEGTEELWTYQYGISPDLSGIRSVTVTIVNSKVKEWYDWVDTSR